MSFLLNNSDKTINFSILSREKLEILELERSIQYTVYKALGEVILINTCSTNIVTN